MNGGVLTSNKSGLKERENGLGSRGNGALREEGGAGERKLEGYFLACGHSKKIEGRLDNVVKKAKQGLTWDGVVNQGGK